VKMYTNYKNTI